MTPEEMLDLSMSEPPDGSVIELKLAYPGSPITYTYAGIRIRDKWYLTGQDGLPQTWDNLLRWINFKKATIVGLSVATAWEQL